MFHDPRTHTTAPIVIMPPTLKYHDATAKGDFLGVFYPRHFILEILGYFVSIISSKRMLSTTRLLVALFLATCSHGASVAPEDTYQFADMANPVTVETAQILVLRDIFDATEMASNSSRHLHNWFLEEQMELSDYCSFTGVSCDGPYVTHIHLDESGLAGTLPNSIGELNHLQRYVKFEALDFPFSSLSKDFLPQYPYWNLSYSSV